MHRERPRCMRRRYADSENITATTATTPKGKVEAATLQSAILKNDHKLLVYATDIRQRQLPTLC